MADEITFRTAVGGYRKDEVQEYVENMNDEIFRLKKMHEDDSKNLQTRINDLEALLLQERKEDTEHSEESARKIQELETENDEQKEEIVRLQEDLAKMEERWKASVQKAAKFENERNLIKEKLGREVIRLRNENQKLTVRAEEAEKNAACREDYEAVRDVVSDIQYKIAEYVNVINKTQQGLAAGYQSMNSIKKKIVAKINQEEE